TSTRLLQDVDAIQNRFVRLSAPWGAGAALLAGIVLCAFASSVTAIAVAAIGGVYILVAITVAKIATDKAGRDTRVAAGRFKHELTTLMAAAPELRAYGMTQQAGEQILGTASLYETAQRRLAVGSSWQGLCQTLAMAAAVVAVFVTTANQSAPLMALALLGSIGVLDAAGTLIGTLSHKGSIDAAMERLEPLVSQPESNISEPLQSRIEIGDQYVLRTRERLGLGGPSGAGKTTFVEQLMHLRPVVSGAIRLDGNDLTQVSPQQARALFSYAPQQAQFITGTVAQNLRLAAPTAADEDLWAALEDACLAPRILQSPQGLNMQLGENARYLSGGERRRLGLARAYLRHAPFLVLDEPTEGLDAATEACIIERLDNRLKLTGQGLILISHRPAPLRLCHDIGMVTGRDSLGRVDITVPANAENHSSSRVV
ncbi:ATP-binding cassette domain-containing protein, partial [Brevundimonas sp.]